MTFFSVIIPTYNRANLVVDTLRSVLRQTFTHFEVLLIDDGSTDNTRDIVESTFKNELRVKYFYKKNEERGAARNFGLKLAKGDYAVFFDSDDWMLPDYLDTLDEIIKEKKGISLLACKYNYDNGGAKENNPELQRLPEGWYDLDFFLKGNILACNYCIKIKDHSYKLFPEERELAAMEDWLFLLANLEHEKIFIRDKVCITMRQHPGRSMQDNPKVINARKKAAEWALTNINLNNSQKKKLLAWSHYFCGVHQYLDHKGKESMRETAQALKLAGLNMKFIILFLKAIIGRRIIKAIK